MQRNVTTGDIMLRNEKFQFLIHSIIYGVSILCCVIRAKPCFKRLRLETYESYYPIEKNALQRLPALQRKIMTAAADEFHLGVCEFGTEFSAGEFQASGFCSTVCEFRSHACEFYSGACRAGKIDNLTDGYSKMDTLR